MLNKLKKRWNVDSNLTLVTIFIVFAITGYSSLQIAKPFLSLVGITETSVPYWIYRVLRLVLIFPIYQLLLILIGTLFGQFTFFWEFEKKMLNRMKLGFITKYVDNKIKKGESQK